MTGTFFPKKELERLGQQLDQAQVRRAPLMEPSFEGLPEADRATLQAAAKGGHDRARESQALPHRSEVHQAVGEPDGRGPLLARRPSGRK